MLRLGLAIALFSVWPCDGEETSRYPTRPIALVVGFPAGGESDRVARILADELTRTFGQAVVVQNRGGAGGIIAAQYVAKAPPDGYTTLLSSMGPLSVAPLSDTQIAFHPAADLVPISLVAMLDLVLVIHPSVPADSLSEFVAFVKANPGRPTYASTGIGSASHLAGELFKQEAALDIVHVPYQGAQQIRRDVLAGDVLAAFAPAAAVLPYVQAGKLRALAWTGASRFALMPQIPTFAEQGFPGYRVTDWYALAAPSGTPSAILDALNRNVVRILNAPDTTKKFAQFGLQATPTSISAAASFIASERERWAELLSAEQRPAR